MRLYNEILCCFKGQVPAPYVQLHLQLQIHFNNILNMFMKNVKKHFYVKSVTILINLIQIYKGTLDLFMKALKILDVDNVIILPQISKICPNISNLFMKEKGITNVHNVTQHFIKDHI